MTAVTARLTPMLALVLVLYASTACAQSERETTDAIRFIWQNMPEHCYIFKSTFGDTTVSSYLSDGSANIVMLGVRAMQFNAQRGTSKDLTLSLAFNPADISGIRLVPGSGPGQAGAFFVDCPGDNKCVYFSGTEQMVNRGMLNICGSVSDVERIGRALNHLKQFAKPTPKPAF